MAFQNGEKNKFSIGVEASGKTFKSEGFSNVLPITKDLFCSKQIPNVPSAGRLKDFVMNWQKIASDLIALG